MRIFIAWSGEYERDYATRLGRAISVVGSAIRTIPRRDAGGIEIAIGDDSLRGAADWEREISEMITHADLFVVLFSGTGSERYKSFELGQIQALGPGGALIPLILPFYSGPGLEKDLAQVPGMSRAMPLLATETDFVERLIPRLLDLEGISPELVKPVAASAYREHLDIERNWRDDIERVHLDVTRPARLRYEAMIAASVLALASARSDSGECPAAYKPRMRVGELREGTPSTALRFLCLAPLQLRTDRRPVWLAWCLGDEREPAGLVVIKEDVGPASGHHRGEKEWLEYLKVFESSVPSKFVRLVAWGKHVHPTADGRPTIWLATRFCLGGTLQQYSGAWKWLARREKKQDLERYLRDIWRKVLGPLVPGAEQGADADLAAFHRKLREAFGTGRYERWLASEEMAPPPAATAGSQRSAYLKVVCSVFAQTAGLVDTLKRQNVVHGDIKPANVLLDLDADDRLVVQLCDFESACSPRTQSPEGGPASSPTRGTSVTRHNTPGFDAPEVADTPSHLSDVYSLCVSVVTTLAALHRVPAAHESTPRLHVWGVQLPEYEFSDALVELLQLGTSSDPGDRPDPESLREWFQRASELAVHSPESPIPPRVMRGNMQKVRDALHSHIQALEPEGTRKSLHRILALRVLDSVRVGEQAVRSFGALHPKTIAIAPLRERVPPVWLAWDLDLQELVVVREHWSPVQDTVPGHQVKLQFRTEVGILARLKTEGHAREGGGLAVELVKQGNGWLSTRYVYGGSLDQRYFRDVSETAEEQASSAVLRTLHQGLEPERGRGFLESRRLREEARALLPKVVRAVAGMHLAGVVHRKLALEDILVERRLDSPDALERDDARRDPEELDVRLMQFGSAHHPEVRESRFLAPRPGTRFPDRLPFYPPDARLDASACCMCLIDVLTGRRHEQLELGRNTLLDELNEVHIRREVARMLVDGALLDGAFKKPSQDPRRSMAPEQDRVSAALAALARELEVELFDKKISSQVFRASRALLRGLRRHWRVSLPPLIVALGVLIIVYLVTVAIRLRPDWSLGGPAAPVYAAQTGPYHSAIVAGRSITQRIVGWFTDRNEKCPSIPTTGDVYVHWDLRVPRGCLLEVEGGRTLMFRENVGIIVENGGGIRLGEARSRALPPVTCRAGLTPEEFFRLTPGPGSLREKALSSGFLALRPREPRAIWKGVTILGEAPTYHPNARGPVYSPDAQFEACPVTAPCHYGERPASGKSPLPPSGSVNVNGILVEGAGATIVEDHEFNAITLAGVPASAGDVGRMIILDPLDDCVEMFGGDIHVHDVWCRDSRDEVIDFEEGYGGAVDNVVAEYTKAYTRSRASVDVVEVTGFRAAESPKEIGRIGRFCLLPEDGIQAELKYAFQYRPDWNFACLAKAYRRETQGTKLAPSPGLLDWSGRPEDLQPQALSQVLDAGAAAGCHDVPPLDLRGLAIAGSAAMLTKGPGKLELGDAVLKQLAR